jgi:nitrogen fixation-related uncharacterized protein
MEDSSRNGRRAAPRARCESVARENAMRHFVRFAKLAPNGLVDRGGWRLRIFLTPGEAGDFARALAQALWRVETGQYEDGDREPSAMLARRFRAEAAIASDRRARNI